MFRRVRTALLLVVLAGSFAVGCQSDQVEVNPGLAIARLGEVPENGAIYSVTHNLFLADAGDAGLIGLSRRSPFQGCTLQYLELGETVEGFELAAGARFVDPCHGGQFDIAGRHLAGPGDADMAQLPVEVIGQIVYLDPS